jgi:hypothetical protein
MNKLKEIQKLLTPYFSYFKDKQILAISEDKASLPFAFLINDKNYPNSLLLSIAVDYPNSITVVDLTLISSSISNILLSEAFYISPSDGKTYFGDNAYSRWDLEMLDLNGITPESKQLH